MKPNAKRPFPDSAIPDAAFWRTCDAFTLPIASLTPTQYLLVIDRLLELAAGAPPEGGDLPHVILCAATPRGVIESYIVDGHHRTTLAELHLATEIHCRVHSLCGTWQSDGCSHPGCGYPDGKPCLRCGLVIEPSTMGQAQYFQGEEIA